MLRERVDNVGWHNPSEWGVAGGWVWFAFGGYDVE